MTDQGRRCEDIYTSTQVQTRIKEYLLQRHRHNLRGLSVALGCSTKTIYRVRTGNYAEKKPYQTKPSHNRLFGNEDFQKIRDTAETIKAERNKPPPPQRKMVLLSHNITG